MKGTVEKVFEQIKFECRPDRDKAKSELNIEAFDMFFGQTPKEKEHNFIGGINDKRNTLHENMFHAMHPYLTPQVHFGTGKGGLETYLSKRFTVDFLDEERGVIYEIDGRNHEDELQQMKDRIKELFFEIEHGYKTIRYTNEEVEQMVINRLKELYAEGKLHV